MSMSVRLHQLALSKDKRQNLSRLSHLIRDSDTDVDVFPEYAMGVPEAGLTRKFVRKNAEVLTGPFVSEILDATSDRGSAAVFTIFLARGDAIDNAVVLVDSGMVRTVYRKIHLFDAFGHKESELFSSGRELAALDVRGFRIGLAICFDLRFPEMFRAMAYQGVEVFFVPSAWYAGEHKLEQWRALTGARAHENTSYLVAADQAGPKFIGHSTAVSPFGYTVKEADESEQSLNVLIDREEVKQARRTIPVLSLSKPGLYATFPRQLRKALELSRKGVP